MVAKLKRILSLFHIQAKMDLLWLLRDTKFALLAISSDLISNISAIAGVFLLAWRFDGIGGMDKFEVLFMLSFLNIVSGITFIFGANNNLHVSRIIGRGQMEHMFIQPSSIPLQFFTMGFFPFTCCSQFLSGVGLLCVSLWNLGFAVSPLWLLSLVGSVLVSAGILVGISYLFSSLAFYAPVQCEEISSYVLDGMNHTAGFPLSGMPKGLKWPLITLFPAGLLAWFPTMCLLGKPPLGLTAQFPLFVALIIGLLAGYFFKRGMQYYVQKGINRYTSAGRN